MRQKNVCLFKLSNRPSVHKVKVDTNLVNNVQSIRSVEV